MSTPEEYVERIVARDLDGLPLVVAGVTGHDGERGPQGDHGQTGEPGVHGERGATGRGASRIQVLVVFLFIAVSFLLLAYRTEHNARRISDGITHQRTLDYVNCQARNINVERINTMLVRLTDIEKDNPYKKTSPTTIARRIEIYETAHLSVVPCGDRP